VERYSNIPNIESMNEILIFEFYPIILTNLKSKKQFEIIDKIQTRTTVFQCLLDRQLYFEGITEPAYFKYFKWRLLFAYWIRSDQRERIREINSPAIIKLLKLEFPEEMNQIYSTINNANVV